MPLVDPILTYYLKISEEAARIAGKTIVYEAHKKGFGAMEEKTTHADLVTEADIASEKFIINYIKEKMGNDECAFIGEESLDKTTGKVNLTDAPTWIIDPIDGTTNFIHGFPCFVVSIGVAVNKEMVVGVIYDVSRDDCYTAVKGMGAFLNNCDVLKVREEQNLRSSLVVSSAGSGREEAILDVIFHNAKEVTRVSRGYRATGSAAFNLITVARGIAQAYYELGIHVWDMAAGGLIVKEAGGFILDPVTGGEWDMMSRRIICACNEKIARDILKIIKTFELERDQD